MAKVLQRSQSNVYGGQGALDTFNFTVPVGGAGWYPVSSKAINVPLVGISMSININGVLITSSVAFAGAERIVSTEQVLNLKDGDLLSVIITSPSPADPTLNQLSISIRL